MSRIYEKFKWHIIIFSVYALTQMSVLIAYIVFDMMQRISL